ncbi:GNAT family N-acetyltransferase [Micromonospora sp. BQ11]|uniref:GNAT family N-acetyltransferase n=1 Tax=Micromonospora sp. BQ11 TaxID=3452212 RepID=UPI003F89577C
MIGDLRLREVRDEDLPAFYRCQRDPEAVRMAAFTADDPDDADEFAAHWHRVRTGPANVSRTVTVDDAVVGYVLAFPVGEGTEVSYWIDRAHWGRGYATRALRALLRELPQRPLHARAVKDNHGSLAVLRKCGFVVRGEDHGFAPGRGHDVEEWVLELAA